MRSSASTFRRSRLPRSHAFRRSVFWRGMAALRIIPLTEDGSSFMGSGPKRPLSPLSVEIDVKTIDLLVKAGISLVVWDFDLTVLKIHSFALRLTEANVAERSMQDDFADLAFFVSLVKRLTEAGIAVAIASFGRAEVILAYLDRAFQASGASPDEAARRIFNPTNIVTPARVGGIDGWSLADGKNTLLRYLTGEVHVEPSQVLFFDDDPANIAQAEMAGFPHSLHCPEAFTRKAWAAGVVKVLGEGAASAAAAPPPAAIGGPPVAAGVLSAADIARQSHAVAAVEASTALLSVKEPEDAASAGGPSVVGVHADAAPK